MLLRHLPRYATDTRVLGITDHDLSVPMGVALPAFPHNNDGGTDIGGGAAGGDAGEDDDTGTPVAERSAEEQAAYWKKRARDNDNQLKKSTPKQEELEQLRAAKAELDKIRDADRTDSEKAVARAEAAEKELSDLKPKFERLEVAYAKGLPPNLAKRLTGATREEMETDADELLAEFGDAIRKDGEASAAKDKEKRTAARKGAAGDAGPRGTRDDTKPSVASGAELYAARKARKTPAATGSGAASA